MNSDFIESCIRERHEYARHVFTSTVNWFSFFVVLNYGAMSWLAGSDKFKGDTRAVILVACGFIAQNILGVIACLSTVARQWIKHYPHLIMMILPWQ